MHRLIGMFFALAIATAIPAFHSGQWTDAAKAQDAESHDADHVEHAARDGEEEHAERGPITAEPGDVDLALWSLVVFLIFVWLLKKLAWAPLSKAMNDREANIRSDIAAATEARVTAEKMLAEHAAKLDKVQDEVREIIAEARRDAEHTKQDIISQAQKEAEAPKNRAVAEIGRARDAALKDLFDTMAAQVSSATEHVLGRVVSDGDQDRLIEDALAHFRRQ